MYEVVKLNEDDFEEVYEIMKEAFPKDEHRKKENQRKLLEKQEYKLIGVRKENVVVAFIAFWDLKNFIFIEHFAVKEQYRNRKLGGNLLKAFLEIKDKDIILETELPEDDLKIRRINFYKKHGFNMNKYEYIQPSYEKEQKSLELKIMSYPRLIEKETFINELYEHVYNID